MQHRLFIPPASLTDLASIIRVLRGARRRAVRGRPASVIKRPRLQTSEVRGKKTQTDGSREPIREQNRRELVSSDTLTCCLRVTMATEGAMQRGEGVFL